MTIGPENFGNGSSKTEDRFGGQLGGYRSASRRDSGAVLPIDGTGDDLSPRNGLLLELPPKGSMPHQDWLDRWFEAARSILELLYAHESPGR